MIFTTFENSLRSLSFSCLFLTMLFYWIKAGFFQIKKTTKFEDIALIICNFVLISILLIRWIESNHFPLSNLYESLIFLSWSLLSFLLILQIKTKELFIGTIITPIVLFIATFATFSLPSEMQKASALVPALQSNWLMMHVTIMMLSYAALIFGSLFSITFLVIDANLEKDDTLVRQYENLKNQKEISESLITNSTSSTILTLENSSFTKKINLTTKLDNFSYRTIGVGFPLLTIGILSGAVWANETWGSYWNWDPKETWALITWIIYAIYLHSRISKGFTGKKPALIASFGFLAVWICYLGVNIFGKGLHSYGWFS